MIRSTLFRLALPAVLVTGSVPCAPGAELAPGQSVALTGVLTDVTSGRAFDLTSTRGKRTLVFLWVTWCGQCKDYVPELNAMHREIGAATDRSVISICGDNGLDGLDASDHIPEASASRYVRSARVAYPALFDTAKTRVTARFGDEGFPNLFLLDESGKVVASWTSEGGFRPVHGEGAHLPWLESRTDAVDATRPGGALPVPVA